MIKQQKNTFTILPSTTGAMSGVLAGIRAGSAIPYVGPTIGGLTFGILGLIFGPADEG